MKSVITLFCILFSVSDSFAYELHVWNVGQGSWATISRKGVCEHFDSGGEFAPWRKIESLCSNSENIAYYSHWDLDHVSWIRRFRNRINSLCIAAFPGGDASSRRKSFFAGLGGCRSTSFVSEIKSSPRAKSRNEQSRVFVYESQILFPGDAGKDSELAWPKKRISKVKILVLGHHGSRTSTSTHLLEKAGSLKLAIASARKEKYGHPHEIVIERLKSRGVALLKTEDWGSIRVELPSAR
ncbi:MAG: hydrolase [Bdellovibrionota bacterium]